MSQLHIPSAVATATGCDLAAVTAALNPLLNALQDHHILTSLTAVGMLATVAVECSFKPICEIGQPAYFSRYDGRHDLGNVHPGDGYKYRGRGFIQLTGGANYTYYGNILGIDLVNHPDLALQVPIAARIAGLYFQQRNISPKCEVKNWAGVRIAVQGSVGPESQYPRFLNCVNALLRLI